VNKKYLALLAEGWAHGASALADLGLDDVGQLQAKAYLRAAILSRIRALQITQREAARRVGLPQPKMSTLMNDDTAHGFSSDKLMDVATKLGLDVKIEVRPSRREFGRVIASAAAPRAAASARGRRRVKKKQVHSKAARMSKVA